MVVLPPLLAGGFGRAVYSVELRRPGRIRGRAREEEMMLKWILIGIGALFVLVLVLWVVGRMLPREHVATSRARFAQPAETIWAVITDHVSMSGWRNGMKQVVRGADQGGNAVWIETSSFGEIPLRVEEAVPPKRY